MFTDGSASPYAEVTDAQKSAAVAVIFYAGPGDLGDKTLGVGLDTASGKMWCTTGATAYSNTTDATDEYDGNANTNEIKGLSDYEETNYPAFYFCTSYSVTGFTSGWYLPAKMELYRIYKSITTINNAFTALGMSSPFSETGWWSSTNTSYSGQANRKGSFNDANSSNTRKNNEGHVCAIRSFN